MSSNNNITNPKCSNCKCYFIPTIKSSGQLFKTCDKCRTKDKETRTNNKCPHDRRKTECKECKGGSICPHDKRKSTCKLCSGGSICEHEKIRSLCKECKGGSICEHDRMKSSCKECKGGSICEHNKTKSDCKECNQKLCLIRLHSKQIKKYLTSTKYEKIKNHYNDNLGCTVGEFINHITKKIEYFNTYLSTSEQMKLENISIDHIKPVSKFNLDDDDEFLNCCHYSNIQPLLFITNLVKFNKWSEENNKYWNENIKGKEYHEIYIP